ncbi:MULTISPECIES: IclR family transcriptional regulator [Amycolatopsis]|uniref:IclR family transcriptional regulator n=1 Tax=Amycolatopsis TaxID=1813 RepID=UPI001E445E60|nr:MULTISPECIES: helix-turn-helix domain-containing protein [Amycolatopsis]
MNHTGAQPPAGTQAIRRALAVLRLLRDEGGELSLSVIARRLDLTPGTTHRVVGALSVDGLVTHNPHTDCYHLGPGAILLGQAAQRVHGLERALPVIRQVNEETEESVNIAIRDGRESVVLLRAQSSPPSRCGSNSTPGPGSPCTPPLPARRSSRTRSTSRRTWRACPSSCPR